MKKNTKEVSAALLKMIAFVCMLIDHVGYAIVFPLMFPNHLELKPLYTIMRWIGRIAFPIFIFQLVEGFMYTKNKARYALRLFIFCFVSEIPFDLAFSSKVFDFSYQNVFFTLFIGFVTIWGMDSVYKYLIKKEGLPLPFSNFILFGCRFLFLILGCLAAYFLKTDYSYVGVMAIAIGYLMRIHPISIVQKLAPILICLVLLLSSLSELFGFLALIPIFFYHGKKGKYVRWLGYAFYPGHLLLLAAVWWIIVGEMPFVLK